MRPGTPEGVHSAPGGETAACSRPEGCRVLLCLVFPSRTCFVGAEGHFPSSHRLPHSSLQSPWNEMSERVLVNSAKGEGDAEPQDAKGGGQGLEGDIELGLGGGPPPLADRGGRTEHLLSDLLHTHPHPSPHTSFSSLSHPAVGS